MARHQQLPPDTAIHYNPYKSVSGKGKFFLAKIGRKLTGSKPLAKRFEKEADAHRWLLQEVQNLEERIRRFGEVAAELNAHQYAAAVTTFRTLGNCAPSTVQDLAELWTILGRPMPSEIRQLCELIKKLGAKPAETSVRALEYFIRHCPDLKNQKTVQEVFERWLRNQVGREIRLFESAKERRKREKSKDLKNVTPLSPYVRGMKSTMRRFAKSFADLPFHTFDTDSGQGWLDSLDVGANSKIHYHNDLRTLWKWAVEDMAYAKVNPWPGINPPDPTPLETGILYPLDCFRLLHTAAFNEKYVCLLPRLPDRSHDSF